MSHLTSLRLLIWSDKPAKLMGLSTVWRFASYLGTLLVLIMVSLLLSPLSKGAPIDPVATPPPGITKLLFGTAFDNQTSCNITNPLPDPITYPAGTTQVAIQGIYAVPGDYNYEWKITPGFGGRTVTRGCDKPVICGGQICYTQFGSTISRVDGQPLPPNNYQFSLSFNDGPPVLIPFVIPAAGLPPTITTQPINQTIQSGQNATLTVVASGAIPLTYQWYQGVSGDTSTPIIGAIDHTFATPALTETTSYWVRVSNTQSSVDSITATITVQMASSGFQFLPTILNQSTPFLPVPTDTPAATPTTTSTPTATACPTDAPIAVA